MRADTIMNYTLRVLAHGHRRCALPRGRAFHFANVEEERPLGIAESIIEAHAVYRDIRARARHFIPLYEPRIHQRYPGRIVA